MNRKPPARASTKSRVVALTGSFRQEIITQEALRELETAQRGEWAASKHAALLSEGIKAARERGAKVESGALYFDEELEMVRSAHKKERAG